MHDADREIARQSILISSVPPDVTDRILARTIVHSFDRGALIFLQGDPARSIYIVLSGWVKLFRTTSTGAEAVVGVFTKGQSFGEAAALRDDVYPVAAEAATSCRLAQLPTSVIFELMRERPELCAAMLASTFRHLHSLIAQVEALKARTGMQRLAEFLLDLCPVSGGSCAVTLPYDKLLIAGRLGMKPESLSRSFARLREIGVRVSHNQAFIVDVAALRDCFEQDRAAAWRRAE